MYLYFLKYNNYINKTVKILSSLEDYMEYPYAVIHKNFEQKDGVNTSLNIKWDEKTFKPDYVLVLDDDTPTTIKSRWFVTEMINTSGNNYLCMLLRDVLADTYDNWMVAPAFIQKGHVSNDSALIFNKEDFQCNQIKQSEDLLVDESHCSWLVAYYNISKKQDLSGNITTLTEPYINVGAADITSWNIISRYANNGYLRPSSKQFRIEVDAKYFGGEPWVRFNDQVSVIERSMSNDLDGLLEYDAGFVGNYDRVTQDAIIDCINSNAAAIRSALANQNEPQDSFSDVFFYNGKIVKTNDNKFYRISVTPSSTYEITRYLDVGIHPEDSALMNAIEAAFKVGGVFKSGWSGNFTDAIRYQYVVSVYDVNYVEITNDAVAFSYNFTNVNDLIDQPFGILAFPYKPYDANYIWKDNYLRDNLAMEIIRDMAKDGVGASNKLFDVQILPYCPIPGFIGEVVEMSNFNYIDFTDAFSDLQSDQYVEIKNGGTVGTFALIPTSSKFTLNIAREIYVDNTKLSNQCEFYRLCSPNGAAMFEFSPARNLGVSYFNIDCTYKPYQPYIHINPDFKGLYGEDFNDGRGLICAGDFSVAAVGSAWETYKLQNKNYQEIFARQIEGMDTEYDIARKEAIAGMVAGTVQGGVTGAMGGGMMFGGPVGAIGGALVGAGASLAGGIADLNNMEKRYQESRDRTIDLHNYSLQNIKARPDTLTKVDAFTNNNKIWPYLEKYSCTDEEKYIFLNKLEHEGMTVNACGRIEDYIQYGELTFVKAQIYRFEEFSEDTHLAQLVIDELAKGVYI